MNGGRYIDAITALFATLLIASNLASTRVIAFAGGLEFDAGTLLFPATYIFNDLLTEVYGFKRSRRVIWLGFLALALTSAALFVAGFFPPAPGWEGDAAWQSVMAVVPRLVLASLAAYLAGEFANSIVLAKMKVRSAGRFMPWRFIASTAVGQVFDTGIFATVAFLGVLEWRLWVTLVVSNYVFKVGLEALLLPVTSRVVAWVKRQEGVDAYDRDTVFTPFGLGA